MLQTTNVHTYTYLADSLNEVMLSCSEEILVCLYIARIKNFALCHRQIVFQTGSTACISHRSSHRTLRVFSAGFYHKHVSEHVQIGDVICNY